MTPWAVRLSRAADRDVRAALEHYAGQAGASVAIAFRQALRSALEVLSRFPEVGATALGTNLGRPSLRTWPLAKFPYLVIYEVADGRLEVLRVLHAKRDIPASLR